jgi:hypothetical protein
VVVFAFRAGEAPQSASGSKAGIAAVFSDGVSQFLQRGLAQIDAGLRHDGAALTAQSVTSKAGRAQHHQAAPKPTHKASRSSSHGSSHPSSTEVATASKAPASAYRPAGVGTYDANSEDHASTPTYTPPARSAPPQAPSQPTQARATVSSTGESGALGPIHSPNG